MGHLYFTMRVVLLAALSLALPFVVEAIHVIIRSPANEESPIFPPLDQLYVLGIILTHPPSSDGLGEVQGTHGEDGSGSYCVEVTLRSSKSWQEVWYFEVPPLPLTTMRSASVCNIRLGETFRVHFRQVKEGFHELAARVMHPQRMDMFLAVSPTTFITVGHVPPYGFEWLCEKQAKIDAQDQGAAEKVKKLNPPRRVAPPSLATLQSWHLDDNLAAALDTLERTGSKEALASLLTRVSRGLYSFPMLSDRFRMEVLDYIDIFQRDHPNNGKAPNSMNKYGAILNALGNQWATDLVAKVVTPLSEVAFPSFIGPYGFTSHHAFTIRYRLGEDDHLDRHIDESEVTVNVCLGGVFSGATLNFDGLRDDPSPELVSGFTHIPGMAVLHAGQHWHESTKLTDGERHNLVVWAKSKSFRSSPAQNMAVLKCPRTFSEKPYSQHGFKEL